MAHILPDDMPVVKSLADFDSNSGTPAERAIFNNRLLIMLACVVITAALGWAALNLKVNASFEAMMPQSHPYIKNYLQYKDQLKGLGNSVRIVVTNENGDIYDAKYLETLRKISDRVFLMDGVDRSFMKSLWMPIVRWTEITEEGYSGGAVMPDDYDGSQASIDKVRNNVYRSGIIGSLVANNQRSSMLFIPLLDYDGEGNPLDYKKFRDNVESLKEFEPEGVRIHTIGFAKLVGDLILGLIQVFSYFGIAAAIVSVIIYFYTRCIRSTIIVILCSTVASIWQLGLMHLLGFVLDPFSVLIPFLIFAIGVSHGAQKMNGIQQDVGKGTHRYVAARYTFRRLFLTGLTALLADAVGFAVLAIVDIPVIRNLAIEASIGVAILIFTNLILLPILLSFTGVSEAAARRSMQAERDEGKKGLLNWFTQFARPKPAIFVLVVTALFTYGAHHVAQDLQIGDLDPGAPELRPNSQYNQDNAFITQNYKLSSDQLAVIVVTPDYGLNDFKVLLETDRLEELIHDTEGVQTTQSVASSARPQTAAAFEGSSKWITISRDPYVISDSLNNVRDANPEMYNDSRSIAPIIAFLTDHKAATLARVVKVVEDFAATHNVENREFLLAAGNAGIEAATNQAVEKANDQMLFFVYAAVVALCFITFRSWRAVLCAVIPLAVTSIFAEALMVILGIGVKVATLPVIALGVGIGVDYALYLLTAYLYHMRMGTPVLESYTRALAFTGKVVALVGITLSIAVGTWVFSAIKFQADMGVLLAFMFLWNMLGAMIIIPALATFLLRPSKKKAQAAMAAAGKAA